MTLTEPYSCADLAARGLVMPAPSQVYVDRSVPLERLQPGAVLYPGARLAGASVFVGAGARIGSEGPATVLDSAIDRGCEIGSGFVSGAVLLPRAKLGGSTHVRPVTLLEEEASVAHAVGLKQTILLAYVTLGSVINACDLLVAGGTSREDHSEVGSGFIHFNFTPWGARGDKATPTLAGDVVRGVFLRSERVFLGGLSGVVGPGEVGFGSVTVAGQIVRSKVPERRVWRDDMGKMDVDVRRMDAGVLSRSKVKANLRYVGQLAALQAWYTQIRQGRRAGAVDGASPEVLAAAVALIGQAMDERLKRLSDYCGMGRVACPAGEVPACPDELLAVRPELAHLDWLAALDDAQVQAGSAWLSDVAARAVTELEPRFIA